MRTLIFILLLGVGVVAAGCDVCFGAPSCGTDPVISYGGQFINHRTGKPVAGVQISFIRTSGARLDRDTIGAVSDHEGFFTLRGDARSMGEVSGRLLIVPPPPHSAYTVKDVRIKTVNTYGDGIYAGRHVVDPYYLFVGLVRDRKTKTDIVGASIVFQRTGGEGADPDTVVATSDKDGRIFFEISMQGAGRLDADAIVSAKGYPRPYRIPLHLYAEYLDRPATNINILTIGRGLQYVVEALRRGQRKHYPGTTIEFVRTGGIPATPSTYTVALNDSGVAALQIDPLDDGTLIGDLTVKPPAPFLPETTRAVQLNTMDGDTLSLIRLGYGGQIFARMQFVYRATGDTVEEVQALVKRVAGVAIEPDGQLALLDSLGRLNYSAATVDTGSAVIDVELRLRAPHAYESFTGLSVPVRRDSLPTDLGVRRVGRWLPWSGVIRDASTDAPVPSATVEFRRTAGVTMAPAATTSTTAANGSFRFRAVPLRDGTVTGDLLVKAAGFRDTTISGVSLSSSRDDTVRVLAPIRIQRTP